MKDSGAPLYWAGSYPHTKISSGINKLLSHRGVTFKIAFDRGHIDRQVRSRAGAIDFNELVQVELSNAALQLQQHGIRLYANHDVSDLNGNLVLTLDRPWSRASGLSIPVQAEPGQHDLQPIWINGLAHSLRHLQQQCVSARFDLSFAETEDALANPAPELLQPFVLEPKHTAPRATVSTHSWFSILSPVDAGTLDIWVPDPGSRRSETVVLTPSDRHLLTAIFPESLRAAAQTAPLQLITMSMKASNGRRFRFVLPAHQWLELHDAVKAAD